MLPVHLVKFLVWHGFLFLLPRYRLATSLLAWNLIRLDTSSEILFPQITTCFHVDDCKISHEDSEVIDETIDWLKAEYESIFEDGSGEMKVYRGKVHKYLGTGTVARYRYLPT